MSSIYQKGRDGYYYYQAYIFNPKSGKKDKKIFHSLGTKDLNEAKQKQSEYDNKYEKSHNRQNNKEHYGLIKKISSLIVIIFSTIIITIFFNNWLNKKNIISRDTGFYNTHLKTLDKTDSINLKAIAVQTPDSINISSNPIGITENDSTENNFKPIPKRLSLPKYTIQRIERLSGAFEQGKIYITVDKGSNIESLKLLCQKIKAGYSEFSNIIICIYSHNDYGIAIANGIDENINAEEQKQAWLVMYSYNPVEGEYFDNNPGGYLGAY